MHVLQTWQGANHFYNPRREDASHKTVSSNRHSYCRAHRGLTDAHYGIVRAVRLAARGGHIVHHTFRQKHSRESKRLERCGFRISEEHRIDVFDDVRTNLKERALVLDRN